MPMDKTFNAAEAEARISAQWIDTKAFRPRAPANPGAESIFVFIQLNLCYGIEMVG